MSSVSLFILVQLKNIVSRSIHNSLACIRDGHRSLYPTQEGQENSFLNNSITNLSRKKPQKSLLDLHFFPFLFSLPLFAVISDAPLAASFVALQYQTRSNGIC